MTDSEIMIFACGITLGIYLMIAVALLAEHAADRRLNRQALAARARTTAKRAAVRDWRVALTTRRAA